MNFAELIRFDITRLYFIIAHILYSVEIFDIFRKFWKSIDRISSQKYEVILRFRMCIGLTKNILKRKMLPDRESNPGRLGESQES